MRSLNASVTFRGQQTAHTTTYKKTAMDKMEAQSLRYLRNWHQINGMNTYEGQTKGIAYAIKYFRTDRANFKPDDPEIGGRMRNFIEDYARKHVQGNLQLLADDVMKQLIGIDSGDIRDQKLLIIIKLS